MGFAGSTGERDSNAAPFPRPLLLQESFYESGNCVQIICAILGVHPKGFRPTSVQFKGRINSDKARKRHQTRHLEFYTLRLLTEGLQRPRSIGVGATRHSCLRLWAASRRFAAMSFAPQRSRTSSGWMLLLR